MTVAYRVQEVQLHYRMFVVEFPHRNSCSVWKYWCSDFSLFLSFKHGFFKKKFPTPLTVIICRVVSVQDLFTCIFRNGNEEMNELQPTNSSPFTCSDELST